MRYEQYEFTVEANDVSFEFISEGHKGRITKRVVYTPLNDMGLFNLGFGDKNEHGEIDDLAVTDNGDSQKVLATVASTIIHFLTSHPNALVKISGSTPARTRLYRMGISNNLEEIETLFVVYGIIDKKIERFRKNRNYTDFIVKRKF